MKARTISNEVLSVLSAGEVDRNLFFLPARQLDRKLYESTNKVLDALGGKWNRARKAHIFPGLCGDLIEDAIETGEFHVPADMGWFPTPPALAERLVDLAGIEAGEAVLEPSAGEGALVAFIKRHTTEIDPFEIDPGRAATCGKRTGFFPIIRDFLTVSPEPSYDVVVMNPPFAKRADIHHVLHARKFLAPGGRLVAIMSASVLFRDDSLTKDFRLLCDRIEALPEDSFKSSGTSVNTCIVTMSI